MDLVPVVDLSRPASTSLAAVDRACRDHGFFLLTGHGLDDSIAAAFAAAGQFFGAERGIKETVRRDAVNPLGYNDRELTKRLRDHKEVFDLVDPVGGRSSAYNRWPTGVAGFQDAVTAYYDACSEVAERTTSLVYQALGLANPRALPNGDRSVSSMRLNHYTLGDPVPEEERGGLNELAEVALGHHTDLGLLTILVQDDVGGLQAESAEHGWIEVEPRTGTVVVNLADCMQVLTNDQYRAAVHRVRPMTASTRMSIAYFFNPFLQGEVAPIPELAGDDPRYRPFPFRDYLSARGADNYADAGTPDTQIADFRLP